MGNHEVPLQKNPEAKNWKLSPKNSSKVEEHSSYASILLRNKQDSSPCGPRGAKSYVLMLPILNDTEKLVMLPKLPQKYGNEFQNMCQNTIMNFLKMCQNIVRNRLYHSV